MSKKQRQGLNNLRKAARKHPAPQPTILAEAQQLVYGDRARTYGHPIANFANIASLFNGYLYIVNNRVDDRGKLTPIDVANINILQKIARLGTNPEHRDTIIDIAGYAGTIERIVTGK